MKLQRLLPNLDKVIDINYYPTEKTERSNLLHRPIGIGIQGLADVFAMMDLPFASDEAKDINKKIFETIYHASIEQSMELSKARDDDMRKLAAWDEIEPLFTSRFQERLNVKREYSNNIGEECFEANMRAQPIMAEILAIRDGAPVAYSSFLGSPLSNGRFQFDLWGVTPSDRYDWASLKQSQHGVRPLLVAPMPTVSTSDPRNNECFEPFTIFILDEPVGEFVVVNRHLMKELTNLGIVSEEIKDSILPIKEVFSILKVYLNI